MKTKIKRHYRSVVSVLLSVCILVSCIAVGLIGTDAARVTDDEAVGYSGGINIGTSNDNSQNPYYTLDSDNSCEFTVQNNNTTIYWGFYVQNKNFWNTSDADPDGSDSNVYYAKTDGSGCISKSLNAGTYKFTVTNVWENDHNENDSTIGYKLEKQPDTVQIAYGTSNDTGIDGYITLSPTGTANEFASNPSDALTVSGSFYIRPKVGSSYPWQGSSQSDTSLVSVSYESEYWQNCQARQNGNAPGYAFYYMQTKDAGSGLPYSFTYNTSTKTVTVTCAASPLATSVALTSSDTVTDANDKVTLTATLTGDEVPGESKTYTFTGDNGFSQEVTTTDSSTSIEVTQNNSSSVNYTVKVSKTGYKPVTSSSVTVTNPNVHESHYAIAGLTTGGWPGTYAAAPVKVGNYSGTGEVFYVDVTINSTTATDQINKFRLINKSDKKFSASSNATSVVAGGSEVTFEQKDDNTNDYMQLSVSSAGTYRLFVDESTKKIWLEEIKDIYKSTSALVISESEGVKSMTKTNADTITYGGIANHAELNSGNAITTEQVFSLSDTASTNLDLAHYTVLTDKNVGVKFYSEDVVVPVTSGEDVEEKTLQVFHLSSNTVNVGGTDYSTKNVRLHFDFDAKTVYATATMRDTDAATTGLNNSEKIRYYFAEEAANDDANSDSLDGIKNGIKVAYWNNTVLNHNAVPADNATGSGKVEVSRDAGQTDKGYVGEIYVNFSGETFSKMGDGETYSFSSKGDDVLFRLYYIDIPVWATTFRFLNSSGGGLDQFGGALNPNRVYILVDSGGAKSTAIVLDDSLKSTTNNQNRPGVKTFKANTIKINSGSTGNATLETVYSEDAIRNALYYGVFISETDGAKYNYRRVNNLAQRNSTTNDDNATFAKRAYHAMVWGLSSGMLDTTRTNVTNGYWLMDTDNKTTPPYFDYDNVTDNGVASKMYTDTDFPFYKSTFNGITTYSFDSLVDPNRRLKSDHKTYEYTVTDTNPFIKKGQFNAFAPFGANEAYAVATEFDIPFYMTPTGTVIDNDENEHDIIYSFSGDDDVWVYIDGVKVLDLGGDHAISAGVINLTDMKVYYKNAAAYTDTISTTNESYAWSADSIYTVDLNVLFKAYGVEFNNTNATKKHMLQMFYMERGESESNFSASFNLPQNTGLRIQNDLDLSGVNPAFKEEVKKVADDDYFNYSIDHTITTDAEYNAINSAWTANTLPAKATTVGSDFSVTPKYPFPALTANENRVQTFSDGTSITKLLAKAGQTEPNTGDWNSATEKLVNSTFSITGLNYKLSDAYVTPKKDLSGTIATADGKNTINLLFDQAATFEKKFTPHTTLKIVQDNTLYNVKENTDNITKSDAASTRTVSAYYKTAYTVVDDGTQSTIGSRDSANNLGSGITAKDMANNNGFYFTDYSGSNPDSVAMTVDYVNSPATGDIKITKLLDGVSATKEFLFEVKFSNVFGGSDNTAKPFEKLTYDVMNGASVVAANVEYGTKGIAIQPGQTAVIRNVPVGTNYTITEKTITGFTIKSVTGTLKKDTTTDISSTAVQADYSVEYSVPALTSSYDTSEAAYVVTNKEKLQSVFIDKVITNSGDASTNFPVKIKVTLDGETDSTTSYTYRIGSAAVQTATVTANSPLELNIQQGTRIEIQDIPVGAKVEVEEGTPLPTNFSFVSIGVDSEAADDPAPGVSGRNVTFYIAKDQDPTVTITNVIETRNVKVYKKVNTAKDAGDTTPFEISLSLTENGATDPKTLTNDDVNSKSENVTLANNKASMNADGEFIEIKVPIDAAFKVKETGMSDNYYFEKITTIEGGSAVTLGDDGAYTVPSEVSNVYVYNLKKVNLEVQKTVTGTSETNVPFYFKVLKLVESEYTDYATTYTVRKTDNETEDRSVVAEGDNAGAVALYSGETIVISGLTHNQDFRVYEMNVPSNYRPNGRISTGSMLDFSNYNPKNANIYGADFKVTTGDAKLTINNDKVTTLQVTKKVTDAPYDYTTKFKVRIMKYNGSAYVDLYDGTDGNQYAALTGKNKSNTDITRNAQGHSTSGIIDYYYYEINQDDILDVPNIVGGTQIKVIEVGLDTTHYLFDAVNTKAENISGSATVNDNEKSISFTVSADTASLPKVSVYNTAITHTVTVRKTTNFYLDDGSTFKIKVTYNPFGKTGDYINATTGTIYDSNGKVIARTGADDLSQNGEYVIQKDWYIVFPKITHGTSFVVDEIAYGDSNVTKEQRFILDKITDGNIELNATNEYFKVEADKVINVKNKIFKNEIDIQKKVNRITGESTDSTTTHTIIIDMWKNGAVNDADHYSPDITNNVDIVKIKSSTDNGENFSTETTITSFPFTYHIKENEIIRLSGVYAGSFVSVQESVVGTNYQFDKFEYSNIADYKTESEGGTDNNKYLSVPKPTVNASTKTLTFQTKNLGSTDTRAQVKVYNTPIRARYVINYLYKPYFLLTDTDTSAIQSYTVTDTFTPAELTDLVQQTGDTISFREGTMNARKTFLSSKAPFEDNFMESLTWDSVMEGESGTVNTTASSSKNDETGVITMTINFTANVATNRTVYAYFRFPYETDSNLSAANGVTKKDAINQQKQSTQYGKWISLNNIYDDEDAAKFVTAPEFINDGGTTKYFHHWEILSASDNDSRNAGKVQSLYKKCYYKEFNMTMYHDCYVTPVFETGGPFVPSELSLSDTSAGEASINFIENSRNQWNNNGGTSPKNTSRVKEGDRIYSDFVITVGHNDDALNGYVMVGDQKKYYQPGFVLEKVAELEAEEETKTAQQYEEQYRSTFNSAYVQYKITGTGTKPEGYDAIASNFIANQAISAKLLDNKNQMKYSFSIPVRDDRDLSKDSKGYKNYVYRAYSYLKDPNGTLLKVSDPVYFTIKDMASIANGTTYSGGGQS